MRKNLFVKMKVRLKMCREYYYLQKFITRDINFLTMEFTYIPF